MRLNTLRSAEGAKPSAKRVGRGIGSGLGKTSGRGHKGQKARKSGNVPAGFEGGQMPLYRRLPKFGFNSHIARETAEIRLSQLQKINADVITFSVLKEQRIVEHHIKYAKVILSGTLEKAVHLKGIRATKGARAAIEAAGGKVEE